LNKKRCSLILKFSLSAHQLGASGGPFLVPPRKGERMRLKEALTAACSRRRAALLKNSSGTLLRQNSRVFVLIRLSLSTLSKQLILKTLQ